jgi:hypothetical protein
MKSATPFGRLAPAATMFATLLFQCQSRADEVAELVTRIKAVQAEGSGNAAASRASRELANRGPDAIVPLLEAMNDADAVAANWLRAAVDAIAERTVAAGKELPATHLEKFVLDRRHTGKVRRLAFEWLARADVTAADRLIPGMLDDPGLELRRDAVARAIEKSQELLDADDTPAATESFRKVFAAARDNDQVTAIAKQLESLGAKPDLTKHFGCVQKWHLIAPFDNTDKSGFDRVYTPEKQLDLKAEHKGKDDAVQWIEHTSADQFGVVDLNKVIGKHMGVVAYGLTTVESAKGQPVRIHAGSPNAIKIWLNGKLIYTRDEYHHGMSMDQYQATGTLRSGRNTILIKLCQNEQTEEWAQNWMFQLRVCDPTGGGL